MKYSNKRILWITLSIITGLIIITIADIIRISSYKIYARKPEEKIQCNESEVYYDLVNGESELAWNDLDGTLEYIKTEYDCSDFRLVNLTRILYDFDNKIPKNYKDKIEDVLFNFRYWWDEPGENSMCYWSENHQILFASAEYLIGQKYPKNIFYNSGLTGEQHMDKSRVRILDWLQMRWDYGFTEFYSNVYYKEDIAALLNLIDYADDEEIVKKCQIILDLLFYDVASQNSNLMFVSASGRAYEGNRKGGTGATLGGITQYYWGHGKTIGAGMTYGLMLTDKYKLPPVLKEIALDSTDVIIKQTNGLNLDELRTEGYYGTDTRSMMMQWGMEAFTNPEIIRNSLSHIRSNNMFSNDFITDFKLLDFSLLRWLHLEPFVVKVINPPSNGVAIQKGNTYTYRTKDYLLYTAQNHQVGDYADQQHIFGMNIKNHFAIFHCHPALEAGVKSQSPNYWVGYGHLPHSMQDKNVNLSIYNLPSKKGLMEKDLLDYTHAYFPKAKFDSVVIDKNHVFGKKGETYCVFIGANDFKYRNDSNDDIIQKGKQIYWITEASSKTQDGSFDSFIRRIKSNELTFEMDKLELIYHSNGNKYALKFDADFKVNSKVVDTKYMRYDSPYIKADHKAKTLEIERNGMSLYLDFEKMIRNY